MYNNSRFSGGNHNNNRFNQYNNSRSRFGSRSSRRSRPSIDITQYINKDVVKVVSEPIFTQFKYEDLNITRELKNNLQNKGYTTLTNIQTKTIPVILEGKDLIGISNTGTGKTAAFLIPLIEKILNDRSQKVLIIVPTRELATQINTEFMQLARDLKVYSIVCIGGQNIHKQKEDLKRKYNFLISTPGRLKDLMQRNYLHLDIFNNVVIDEVDRMFDMGFIKDVKIILNSLQKERQSMVFSATINAEIQNLFWIYLKNPVKVTANQEITSSSIYQDIIRLKENTSKIDTLHDLLIQEDFKKVLIFAKTKHMVEKLKNELRYRAFKVDSIHGNKTQAARQSSLNAFKKSLISILVATDVAARGIDIPNVSHVINYEPPETYADYIHRIGRTGRGDKTGIALTFIS